MSQEAISDTPSGPQTFQAIKLGISQKVAVSGTSAQSAAFGTDTTIVRLVADNDCFVALGSNPTAVADGTNLLLLGGIPEYFGVVPGTKVAAIQSTTSGNLYITEGA